MSSDGRAAARTGERRFVTVDRPLLLTSQTLGITSQCERSFRPGNVFSRWECWWGTHREWFGSASDLASEGQSGHRHSVQLPDGFYAGGTINSSDIGLVNPLRNALPTYFGAVGVGRCSEAAGLLPSLQRWIIASCFIRWRADRTAWSPGNLCKTLSRPEQTTDVD